jgi:hypothetical protein
MVRYERLHYATPLRLARGGDEQLVPKTVGRRRRGGRQRCGRRRKSDRLGRLRLGLLLFCDFCFLFLRFLISGFRGFFRGITFHGLLVSLVLLSVLLVLLALVPSRRVVQQKTANPPSDPSNSNAESHLGVCCLRSKPTCECNNEDHRAFKNDAARR